MEQYTLSINKTLLENHIGYICNPCRNWLSRLYLHLAAEVCASSNNVIHHSVQKLSDSSRVANTSLQCQKHHTTLNKAAYHVGSSALCRGNMLHSHMGSIPVHHWEAHSMSLYRYKLYLLLGIPWQQPGEYPLQVQLKTTLLRSVKNIYLQPIILTFQKFYP